MDKINVEYVSLDSIKEYKMNCKLHPAEQIEQIKKRFKERHTQSKETVADV